MSPPPTAARSRPSERSVVEASARHLESSGYRVYIDLDGTDYFDLVARRGDEVGLIEAKVADGRTVLVQALTRRVWGSWGAVVLSSERAAERLVAETGTGRAAALGVWACASGSVRVLRAARPWVGGGADDPYAPLRERFRRVLDAVDRGDVPTGVSWDGLLGEIRRASGGRRFAEWRLDEPPGPDG